MKLLRSGSLGCLALSSLVHASSSFAGSNLYFLHGLSASDQASYINTLAVDGAKVVRIWINGLGTGCVKGSNVVNSISEFETTIGTYNYATLAALDKVLAQLAANGMKAIISPHDGNDIHDNSVGGNGCDIYCQTYGISFYSSTTAQAQFDARIKAILTYTSPSSGKMWGNWTEAILAFDLENEPFQFTSDGANNDPSNWLCKRAANFKNYILNSDIKVATGGIGGDWSHGHNLLPKALTCSSIDLLSVHAYVGSASTWSSMLSTYKSQAAANNKLVYVEEWGVATNYASNFDSQAAAINAQNVPWIYWQFIPGSDGSQTCNSGCCTGYDSFEIGLSSSKGNIRAAIAGANSATAAQDWSFAFNNAGGTPTGGGGTCGSTTTGVTTGGGTPTPAFPADTCKWGCEGWSCSNTSPCQSPYACNNGICNGCTWGCNGWSCSASQPCNVDYTCVSGYCHHSGPATG